MPRLIACRDCLSVEVLPDLLGPPEEMKDDPLLMRIVVRHRGPLNRQQLASRPPNAPRVREIRDELIPCDMCNGGGCSYCAPLGTPGKLQKEPHRISAVFAVKPDDWALDSERIDPEWKRKAVLKKIWAQLGGEHTGYPEEFYASKDTYREDAGFCYQRHGRPGYEKGPDSCIDYQIDAKRLTDREWRARHPDTGDVFLCSFCPYESVVMTRKRAKRGDYAD
jgi:hypothetical protein